MTELCQRLKNSYALLGLIHLPAYRKESWLPCLPNCRSTDFRITYMLIDATVIQTMSKTMGMCYAF
jgi:hypothetical protein